MGISFGGMQTFQWIVSYPTFMDKAIPIVGSPQSTSYDLLLWQAYLDAIEEDAGWHNGDYTSPPMAAIKTAGLIDMLAATTPEYRVTHTSREEFPRLLDTSEQTLLKECVVSNVLRDDLTPRNKSSFVRCLKRC